MCVGQMYDVQFYIKVGLERKTIEFWEGIFR